MIQPDQAVHVVAFFASPVDKALALFVTDNRAARQQPQVVHVMTADVGRLVVIIKIENHIRTIKWTEERYLEMPYIFVADKVGLAFRFVPCRFFTRVTAIEHANSAIVTQRGIRG